MKTDPMAGGTKNTTNRTRHLDNSSWQSYACTEFIEVSIWTKKIERSEIRRIAGGQSQKDTATMKLRNKAKIEQFIPTEGGSEIRRIAGGQTQFCSCLWSLIYGLFTKQTQMLAFPIKKRVSRIQKCKTKPIILIFNPITRIAKKTNPIRIDNHEKTKRTQN